MDDNPLPSRVSGHPCRTFSNALCTSSHHLTMRTATCTSLRPRKALGFDASKARRSHEAMKAPGHQAIILQHHFCWWNKSVPTLISDIIFISAWSWVTQPPATSGWSGWCHSLLVNSLYVDTDMYNIIIKFTSQLTSPHRLRDKPLVQ